MGLFDKLKSAVNAVTGNAAKVTMEFQPAVGFPGQVVQVRITATSTGGALNSKGVFVDLLGTEAIHLKGGDHDVHHSETTLTTELQVGGPFQLGPNETKQFAGQFTVPPNAQPSYAGRHVHHTWQIRGRIEATGNDPDTGFLAFRIGLAQ